MNSLIKVIVAIESEQVSQKLLPVAQSIVRSIPEPFSSRQLFVDVSALLCCDHKTGIQRVVRSLLKELLGHSSPEMRVEPVYATPEHGYCYARQFTLNFLGCSGAYLHDEPVAYQAGDIFLGLGFQPNIVVLHQEFFGKMRCYGVRVLFVVYDLLCLQMPHYFNQEVVKGYKQWLDVVMQSDGMICISGSVAEELKVWMKTQSEQRLRSLNVSSFHLGADIENSVPTIGLPDNAENVLRIIRKRRSFLLVGILEPRKGHCQVLDAFERLWAEDIDVNLVFVGRQGGQIDELVEKINRHPQAGQHFFWLEGISDEYLHKIYNAVTCLIFASEGEGFGLPLIEAARYKIPIIARDIPVFREVAGEFAFYFRGCQSVDLYQAIQDWLQLYQLQQYPQSDAMPWLTWQEATAALLTLILP